MDVLIAKTTWTQMIVAEMMLRRLWEIYAIPQIASLRDMWLFYVRAAGLLMHWLYGWYYHGLLVSQAAHKGKNVVWDDVIGAAGTDFVAAYEARHRSGWYRPAHAATA